jgi:predicted acetyltransferase
MLYISSGIASISMVSTLPDSRKKGIGTSMVLKPLYDAKSLGYEIAVLQATRAGESVYKKIGFKEYSLLNVLNIEL